MNKPKPNQKGFTVVEAVIILVVIIAIGGVGWLVYSKNHKKNNNESASATSAKQTSPETKLSSTAQPAKHVDPYAGWKSYTSTLGGFSVKYPGSGWTLTAYHSNSGWVTGSSVTANESQFAINENSGQGSSSSSLKYSVSMDIESSVSAINQDQGALTYGLGSIQETLSNGVQLWRTSEHTFNAGGVPSCAGNGIVMLKAVSNNNLYIKLPNGRYFNFTSGFCNGPDQKLAQSYQQQISDSETTLAKKMLESVSYK